MSQFHVGDIVQAITDYPESNKSILAGDIGTVCDTEQHPGLPPIGVFWENKVKSGHDCRGHCDCGYGWYVQEYEIELFEAGKDSVVDTDSFLAILSKT